MGDVPVWAALISVPLWATGVLSSDRRLLLAAALVAAASVLITAARRVTRPGAGPAWLAVHAGAAVLALGSGLPSLVPHGTVAAVVVVALGIAVLGGRPGTRPQVLRWLLDIVLALSGWAALAAIAGLRPSVAGGMAAGLAVAVATAALLRLSQSQGLEPRTTSVLCAGLITAAAALIAPEVGWAAALATVMADRLDKPHPDRPPHRVRRALLSAGVTMVPLFAAGLAVSRAVFARQDLPRSASVGAALLLLVLVRALLAVADELRERLATEARVSDATAALRRQEAVFRALVQRSADVITIVDRAGVVRYQSPAVAAVLGHDPGAITGTPFARLLSPADIARVEGLLDAAAARGPERPSRLECRLRHADGGWRDTETVVVSSLSDPDIRGLVLTTRDVTERRQLEADLTRAASTDSLTGLASRALFRERVERALDPAQRSQTQPVVVIFCDLDGFKAVNDTEGHAVGDQLLQAVAGRIGQCVRPTDTVARLGGDEFAILVTGAGSDEAATTITERVAAALSEPFRLAGRELYVGNSAGIASTSSGPDTAELLMHSADLAMYRAKASAETAFVRFEPAMGEDLLISVAITAELVQAQARGEFAVHYQPIVDLTTGRILGAEALLRWLHPMRGVVPTAEYLRLAEQSGSIVPLGAWALREAVTAAVAWQPAAAPGEHFDIAVNISRRQLDPALVDVVAGALAASGLAPGALILEIAESALIERSEELPALLHQLKALGVRLAIDDFGTGYSSLSSLSCIPVDILKIDQSFVGTLSTAMSSPVELTRTMISLGQSLRMTTVAEGIERGEQLAALREMGCRQGQGFLFARPMPAGQLSELLSHRPPAAGPTVSRPAKPPLAETDLLPAGAGAGAGAPAT